MDLVEALKTAKSINNFIEGDQFAIALADIGKRAAVNAILNVEYAKDKKAQVWSAVNHLEGADAALKQKIISQRLLLGHFRPSRLDRLIYRRKIVLYLMAICFKYLKEPTLYQNAMTAAENAGNDDLRPKNDSDLEIASSIGRFFLYLPNPLFWWDVTFGSDMDVEHFFLGNGERELRNIISKMRLGGKLNLPGPTAR